MYGTDYFIRFVSEKEHAESDLERGYSFHEYLFFDTEEQAREFGEDMNMDTENIVAFQRDGGTVYAFAMNGLCGFGPYETVEEAEEQIAERGGYNGVEWPLAAIYTGSYSGQADGDGDMFSPTLLVKVVATGRWENA